MGVDTKELFEVQQISATSAFLAGSANNGGHAQSSLTAMFIATGQDVADISESPGHSDLFATVGQWHDLYWSVTLTSLIVGTHGGGTGLPTQKECLEMLDCHGPSKADRIAGDLCGRCACRRDVVSKRRPARLGAKS